MSLDKAIAAGKEHRKQYRRSARFDSTCRCHGSCPYCRDNRLYQDRKNRAAADKQIKDYQESNPEEGR